MKFFTETWKCKCGAKVPCMSDGEVTQCDKCHIKWFACAGYVWPVTKFTIKDKLSTESKVTYDINLEERR